MSGQTEKWMNFRKEMSRYNWKRTIEHLDTFCAIILYVNHSHPLCYKQTISAQQNGQKLNAERSYLTLFVMKSVKALITFVIDSLESG